MSKFGSNGVSAQAKPTAPRVAFYEDNSPTQNQWEEVVSVSGSGQLVDVFANTSSANLSIEITIDGDAREFDWESLVDELAGIGTNVHGMRFGGGVPFTSDIRVRVRAISPISATIRATVVYCLEE